MRWGGRFYLLGLLVAAPFLSRAQQPTPPSAPPPAPPAPGAANPAASPMATAALAAQVNTTITADTEALVVGHTDFRSYTAPGVCLIAVRHAVQVLGRSIAAQEAAARARRTDPTHDTLPAGVATIARACGARFSVATTAPAELPALFELALLGQQDSVAAAVVARRVALVAGPAARAALLAAVVRRYLAAAPARVTAAEALVAQLDALGQGSAAAAVLSSRVGAHQALLALGDATGDWPRVRHEATTLLTLMRLLPDPYAEGLLSVYRSLLLLAARQAPDSFLSYARQLQADAQQVAKAVGPIPPGHNVYLAQFVSYATVPPDSVLWHLAMHDTNQGLIGQPTPPLQADFWFPAKDTVPPGQGHVSLYVELPEACYDSYGGLQVLDPIQSGCQQMYDQIRGWAAQYGPQQVAITLVAWTVPQLMGTVLSGPQTPEEAANNLRWYFLDYLKLPVQHVAVQVTPVTDSLPAPDGRRSYDLGEWPPQRPFQRRYHVAGAGLSVVLTGRDGRYWYGGSAGAISDRYFVLALATPATPAPPLATGPGTPPAAPHP